MSRKGFTSSYSAILVLYSPPQEDLTLSGKLPGKRNPSGGSQVYTIATVAVKVKSTVKLPSVNFAP